MNWKFLTVLTGILVFIGSFAGCSKTSEDKLAGNLSYDTAGVRYSTQIVTILQQNCYQCHGENNTIGSGGIGLYTYSRLKAYVDNGLFLGDVNHATGYIGMPYLLPKLPDCELNTFIARVNAGAPNN